MLLLKKVNNIKWMPGMEESFQRCQETVMSTHADPNRRFYLQSDASKYALGGQLYLLDEQGEIGVVAFTSQSLMVPSSTTSWLRNSC